MNSSEGSSSTTYSYSAQKSQLAQVEVVVLLTFILSLILYPVGIARRRYNSGLLKGLALAINAAVMALIPYVFGLMNNFDLAPGLFPIWGVFLLYVYYSVPNILKFNDPISVGMTFVKLYLHVYYFRSLFPKTESTDMIEAFPNYIALVAGMALIYAGSGLKAFEGMRVMRSIIPADQVQDLGLNNGAGDTHAPVEVSRPGDANDPWLRCDYVVDHGQWVRISGPRITIQEIWSCEEPTFSSSSGDLKSYCLSLSLLWKLLSKFKGRIPYRSSHKEEAWELVRDGLLLSSSSRCPFTVIEVELALLYDYLYNTSCFMHYHMGFLFSMVRHSFCLIGIIVLAATSVKEYHPKEGTLRIQYGKHDVDVLLTWFVTITSAALGAVQLIAFLTSRWSKTMFILTYLSKKSRRRDKQHQGCITKATKLILWPMRGGGELLKPWQRQLGQYSLLDSCSYMQGSILLRLLLHIILTFTGMKFVRPGRKQGGSAPLTKEIKKVVIQTLLARGPSLTNDIPTLQENSDQLPPDTKRKLDWACTRISTDVEAILVWHIATSLCEMKRKIPPTSANDYCIDDVHIATSLSNYCAYLVAFAPDMLRGHVATTDSTCTTTILDAYNIFKSCTKEHDIYQKLTGITTKEGVDIQFDDPNSQRDSASILQQGAVLGRVLVNQIEDPRIRWKVLAGFWAEMILYLAPNGRNEWEHLEKLGDGGEFITHLWALLYHAGIDDQDVNYKAKNMDTVPVELHQV